jgi:NADPH:quinone reductase-like Zn-dependent oxidoreductase
MRQRKSLIGCMLGPICHEPALRASMASLLGRVAAGELMSPLDKVFPLSDAAAAHRRAEQRGRLGRVVMVP